eukprot:jgi/Botrbrau1/9122/Bobra.0305s0026.1
MWIELCMLVLLPSLLNEGFVILCCDTLDFFCLPGPVASAPCLALVHRPVHHVGLVVGNVSLGGGERERGSLRWIVRREREMRLTSGGESCVPHRGVTI